MLIRDSKPVDSALCGEFRSRYSRAGSVFILVVVCMLVLAALGVGMLTVSWGARRNAIMLKNEATAMALENKTSDPASPVLGQIYFHTGAGELHPYICTATD